MTTRDARALKVGDKVKIIKIANSGNSNLLYKDHSTRIKMGDILTISKVEKHRGGLRRFRFKEASDSSYCYGTPSMLEKLFSGNNLEDFEHQIKHIKLEIAKLYKQLDEILDKRNFLKESNSSFFEESSYKAYKILNALKKSESMGINSSLERMNLISKIINGDSNVNY